MVDFLLLPGGDKPLEFLEPVLDEDQLGQGPGLPFFHFHNQESLPVGIDVPGADWTHADIALRRKQKTGLAGGKDGAGLDVNYRDLALALLPTLPIEQLAAIP